MTVMAHRMTYNFPEMISTKINPGRVPNTSLVFKFANLFRVACRPRHISKILDDTNMKYKEDAQDIAAAYHKYKANS